MKKIIYLILLVQSGIALAQTKTVVTSNGEKVAIHPNANNGLTAENGNVQLGGDLVKPTTIQASSVNTLSVTGLQSGTTSDKVMVSDASGVLKTIDQSTLTIEPWQIEKTTNKATLNTDNIYQTGNVGIGTNSPSEKLQVNGNAKIDNKLYLGQAGTAPNTGTSQIVRNNTTGELHVVQAENPTAKSFNYVQYVLTNGNLDWVDNFDTKIPAAGYTLIITGSSFKPKNIMTLKVSSYLEGDFSPVNVIGFVQNGTWRINADYIGSATTDGLNGTWTINCLVINNVLVATIPIQNNDLKGKEIGAATAIPAGL
ncbi:hypothetical protein [Flavobacterium sp. 2]|uniref:hypothetical protein n=1 Tax=Flavobacterium sp. 2 TaxID=308053 RepID=UPI003CF64044